MVESPYHAAKADRLNLARQWQEDVRFCAETFGTNEYSTAVRRFRRNIPNIHKGPRLKEQITNYVLDVLEPYKEKQYMTWKNKYVHRRKITANRVSIIKDIENIANEMLYDYMIQLLEDNDLITYKGEYMGEYEKIE